MNNLRKTLDSSHLILSDQFYTNCEKFSEYLVQWNHVHNLTGNNSLEDINKNIIDSVWPLTFLGKVDTLVDVGTGAGYPGLILAMAMPQTKVYLVEPRVKRVSFLNFVKNSLKLDNVVILQSRVEDIQLDYKIDLITSRAVTNTKLLIELTKKLQNSETKFLFYKGSLLNDEIKELESSQYDIIGGNEERNYLYIKENYVA